jgi:F0F1-type ATP synthase delta subunit
MIAGGVAKRYARALFSLATAEKQIEAFSRQLSAFAAAWDTSDELRTVFENPAYSPSVSARSRR